MDGGGNFRANFGVERDGVSLLAGDGRISKGADLTTGYPEFDHVLLKKLGWWDELDRCREEGAEGKNWKTDPSGGIIRVRHAEPRLPSVRQRQGARGGLELPRPDPAAPRADLQQPPGAVAKYPTHDDKKAFWRLPTLFKSVQEKNKDIGKTYPLILMSSGRLVEFEGGGEETRSNPGWPSCSRTCSSRSTRRRPTTAASATASTSG